MRNEPEGRCTIVVPIGYSMRGPSSSARLTASVLPSGAELAVARDIEQASVDADRHHRRVREIGAHDLSAAVELDRIIDAATIGWREPAVAARLRVERHAVIGRATLDERRPHHALAARER